MHLQKIVGVYIFGPCVYAKFGTLEVVIIIIKKQTYEHAVLGVVGHTTNWQLSSLEQGLHVSISRFQFQDLPNTDVHALLDPFTTQHFWPRLFSLTLMDDMWSSLTLKNKQQQQVLTTWDVLFQGVHEVDGFVQVGALQESLLVQDHRLSEVHVVAELGRLRNAQTYKKFFFFF